MPKSGGSPFATSGGRSDESEESGELAITAATVTATTQTRRSFIVFGGCCEREKKLLHQYMASPALRP